MPTRGPELPAPPLDPSRIGGRYRIERSLAEGGMGAVYCVYDEVAGRELALKRLRGSADEHELALFEREYRTLAGLAHPRIIRAYDYGVDAAGPYYTMELVHGRDLFALAPLSFPEAAARLRDVATCLALLHTRGLLHRDVTPRNVRVTPSGECKLLDFGALISFGVPDRAVGTPPCIPPEALRRAPIDQRADIFSFGALLYWALTRRHAYPAKRIDELPQVWRKKPPPPSKLATGIPKEADTLIMSMLATDPLARPSTMAEVVERLNVLASLPPEDEATTRALAESYLAHADFVGRKQELEALREDLSSLDEGRGSANLVLGSSGMGRTRLLGEVLVSAQLLGVPSCLVDASTQRSQNGTAVALVQRLLDVSPAARRQAQMNASSLAELDRELAVRLGVPATAPSIVVSGDWRARMQEILHAVVAAACSEGRLLLVIDNVDEADDASLAMIAGLIRLTERAPLALVYSARSEGEERASMSWRILRAKSRVMLLSALSSEETLVLARALFGTAPNLERFAEWLHQRTAGLPLHFMELVRRLHGSGVIRYLDGVWVLPSERPQGLESTEVLDDLLAERLSDLSPSARALAEALAVQRNALSREQCVALAKEEGEAPFALLDELVRSHVLEDTLRTYRFTHGLLRPALVKRMSEERKRALHLRCAERELARAHASGEMFALIEAGWHFMQAGEQEKGADTLAEVAYDAVGVRVAFADLQVAAPALEAALEVYTRQGRPLFERLPLMAALAQAGYYEDRVWALRYGDQALAAIRDVAGLSLAERLSSYLGKTLALLLGILIASFRFALRPRRLRRYRFRDVMVQLFGVVTTLTGAASLALDAERAQRIAATLAPFLHLPKRLTPVGIGQFCAGLSEVGRDNEARAVAAWTTLIDRFRNPRYYPTLPDEARPLYLGGLWFSRGVFEAFRDRGGALAAADELDKLDLKLYRMIASALRSIHHAHRCEFDLYRKHREQVEVHAIQIGSAWQVELWEPASMILVYATIGEIVELRRIADRLNSLAEDIPSLRLHAQLAELSLEFQRIERAGHAFSVRPTEQNLEQLDKAMAILAAHPPRSFIGWGAVCGYVARACNLLGRHAQAQSVCQGALGHLGPEDREYVSLFLNIETELAIADAALGRHEEARARLDDLLTFHAHSDNPLTRGRLHEAYTRVCAQSKDWINYRHHLEQTRSWYRRTGVPALIARIARLEALDPARSVPPPSDAASTQRIAPLRVPAEPSPADDERTSSTSTDSSEAKTLVETSSSARMRRNSGFS